MQSYTLYKDSEFHKDRHPFLPPPETPLMDPYQVSIAYGDRSITKLADLLVLKDLSSDKRKDTLHTLNEMVSNQELKSDMIDHFIVLYASQLTLDKDPKNRKEASQLLGSLLFLDSGRKQYYSKKENWVILQNILFDNDLEGRTSVGWMVHRLCIHKDGVEKINETKLIDYIIEAFNKYSEKDMFQKNYQYLIYLLAAFIYITMEETGIKNTLKKKLIFSINRILLNETYSYNTLISKDAYNQIKEYSLSVLKNISIIKEGKIELLQEGVIFTVKNYLNSEYDHDRLYASFFMTGISNNIDAKKQVSEYMSDGKYIILEVRFI